MKALLNKQSATLANLIEEAQLYQALLQVGQEALPEALKPHLVGVGFEQNTLILQIDDNLWSTQLRFFEPTVLAIYQQHFPHLKLQRTQIRVLPISEPPRPKRAVTSTPSAQDAEQMQAIASEIKSPGLKKALERLSQRAEPSSE
ncbi:MAG: DUF721 domain-containing protein [Gammaproteobacteria bacterium]|jgi:hypothetical protein|nr:DUF721 domain-containing protein [Gammaproteobacteria bacterium]MBD3777034.1 DUF721 domain-containing protein [Thiotrichales bacterium]